MTVRIYVEGGGDRKSLRAECRKGFAKFFDKAGLGSHMPRIVASGSRQNAYDDFRRAHNEAERKGMVLLLVDSEGPVSASITPWVYLKEQDLWDRPHQAPDNSVHLMVQCMEAWFLADKECLATFFGQGFNLNALPGRSDIEAIPKNDLLTGLRNASRGCKSKGRYNKAQHSYTILGDTNPVRVMERSRHAKLLIDTLLAYEVKE